MLCFEVGLSTAIKMASYLGITAFSSSALFKGGTVVVSFGVGYVAFKLSKTALHQIKKRLNRKSF